MTVQVNAIQLSASAQPNPKLAHTGYRYRIEALPHQARKLKSLAGACRWVWNYFLHYQEDAYLAARAAGGSLPKGAFSYVRNASELTRLRKLIPWLREADITGLQQTLRDLDRAYTRFFSGEAGHPKPWHHGDDRYRVCGKASFAVDGDWVRLPKLGWLRLRKSRELPAGRVMNVSVGREGKSWFVSFCVEHKIEVGAPPRGDAVGLDLGVAQSVTTSDGEVFHFPVPSKRDEMFLRRLARQVSRKQRGSIRRRRAVDRMARRRHHHTASVRDAAHKLSTRLTSSHSEIHVEDLRLKRMTETARGSVDRPGRGVRRKASLNRSMLAQAHGEFRRQLAYKCERSGGKLILKDPAHTSQECAGCHHVAPENRPSQAAFACVKCGHRDNADRNAARVVLMRPTGGPSVAAHRGKHKTSRKGRCPDEVRTHPRDPRPTAGPTGITAKEAQAA